MKFCLNLIQKRKAFPTLKLFFLFSNFCLPACLLLLLLLLDVNPTSQTKQTNKTEMALSTGNNNPERHTYDFHFVMFVMMHDEES